MSRISYLRNRKEIAAELLGKLDDWRELESKIAQFAPKYVVLVARRMPRLWQVLNMLDILRLEGATVISNFAVPFMRDKFRGQRVACLDDSVNVGTTINETYGLVGNDAIRKCFAFSYNRDTAKKHDIHKKVEYAIADGWNEEDYRSNLRRLTEAINLLARPFELEFPIYRAPADAVALREFPARLRELESQYRPHVLDISKRAMAGLERHSLDIQPGSGKNNKFRFYLDWDSSEIVVVPMAHYEGVPGNRVDAKTGLYKASCALASRHWPEIARVLRLGELLPIPEENRLLFGTVDMDEAAAADNVLSGSADRQCQEKFLSTARRWKELEEIGSDSKAWQLYHCLERFFKLLGKKIGSDNLEDICADFHEMLRNDEERLHLGPSFSQLCEILRDIWHPVDIYTPVDWHARVSQVLDQQIDHGYIVPVMGLSGTRVFRKGECLPYDEDSMQILQCLGIQANPETVEREVAALKGEDLQIFDRLRKEAENPRINC